MDIRILSLLNVLTTLLAACAFPTGVQLPPGDTPVSASPASAVAPQYVVAPEDVLEISVWKEENLSKEVVVRPDGGFSFPLIGELEASGKTADQIKMEITKRLAKFIPDPFVSVSVLKTAGNRIYVIGKVNAPGQFVAGRYIDVLQALSMAGGLTPFAKEDGIKVLRKENGKDVVFAFRYSEVKAGVNLTQNIELKPGDVVVVP